MNELKPCPFCGGEATFLPQSHRMESMQFKDTIACVNCDLLMQANGKYKLFEMWNRRAMNRCKTCKYMTDNAKDANYRKGYCSRWEAGNWYKITADDYCSFWEGMDNGNRD